jgi:hypothetical protein
MDQHLHSPINVHGESMDTFTVPNFTVSLTVFALTAINGNSQFILHGIKFLKSCAVHKEVILVYTPVITT